MEGGLGWMVQWPAEPGTMHRARETGTSMETLLEEDYDFNWYKHLWSDKECSERTEGMEMYLKGTFQQHKVYMAQLRTGGHRLPIETGCRQHIPRGGRLCTKCQMNKVGDKFHLFKCKWLQNVINRYGIQVRAKKQLVKCMKKQRLMSGIHYGNGRSSGVDEEKY